MFELSKDVWNDLDERQQIILSKYTKEGESPFDFIKRVTLGKPALEQIFANREAIWGGRNLYAVGREGNITGSNCYVAKSPQDSLKDIYRANYEIAQTYAYGGGQGLNLSQLRPRGMKVNNASRSTDGVMGWAEMYSGTTLRIQQDGRRGALMLVLNIDHPDVVDFCSAKLDVNAINGANISLAMTDDFMHALLNNRDWTMTFESEHETLTKTVKARDLMEVIAYANHTIGDVGMLFIDNVNEYHLLSEYEDVHFDATNPCGEQPLLPDGSCNLASINLNAFVHDAFTERPMFNFYRFGQVIDEMIEGLDDLLDLLGTRHPLEAQRRHVYEWRSIGLGVMGLADLSLSFGVAYGSKEFIELLDSIMAFMINRSLQKSSLLAKERGTFRHYDYGKVLKSRFFTEVATEETVKLVQQYGLRNSRLLSIAPTGSISNLLGVSGGVEPFFLLGYNRTIESMFDTKKTITVWEKTPQALAKHLGIENLTDLPEWAKVTSQNIQFLNRAKVQATIQKYVDTAISSTFNIPNEATMDDIINIYTTAWKLGLKGATVFRDNCAKVGILKGTDSDHFDGNPATPPHIELSETWYDKSTGETRDLITTVVVQSTGATESKIEHELCPICGEHLVKRGGCTKCSNHDCVFEKCAL